MPTGFRLYLFTFKDLLHADIHFVWTVQTFKKHIEFMPESVMMNLVCLHVFLHVGLLGKGSSADDALERFLSRVTVGRKQ